MNAGRFGPPPRTTFGSTRRILGLRWAFNRWKKMCWVGTGGIATAMLGILTFGQRAVGKRKSQSMGRHGNTGTLRKGQSSEDPKAVFIFRAFPSPTSRSGCRHLLSKAPETGYLTRWDLDKRLRSKSSNRTRGLGRYRSRRHEAKCSAYAANREIWAG